MVLKALIAALTLFHAQPVRMETPRPPTINLSAIRALFCVGEDGAYTGSGFLVGPHQMVTAYHVAVGKWKKEPTRTPICMDEETQTQVIAYKLDKDHDLALMTGPELPTDMPYIKYNCQRPKPGQFYMSYGITGYGQKRDILRENTIVATNHMSGVLDIDEWVEGVPSPGMRRYEGFIAPGMSGGPVFNIHGYAVAINNAGDDDSSQLYDLADTILCTE